VADHALIPLMMYDVEDPDTGRPYANWTTRFAANQLGLAYTPESAHAEEISVENWYDILSRPDVLLGLSDPRFDACGYRGMMVGQLAASYYDRADLFYNLFGDRFTRPVRVQGSQGSGSPDTILIPEVLQPEEGSGLMMRGASVQLLGLLELRDLDYAFEYQSVSRQHDLNFLPLPAEINLSDPEHEQDYSRVRVKLAFRRFATVNPEFEGKSICVSAFCASPFLYEGPLKQSDAPRLCHTGWTAHLLRRLAAAGNGHWLPSHHRLGDAAGGRGA
jgi:molybdate/tungstate transport system substrate-binding protein